MRNYVVQHAVINRDKGTVYFDERPTPWPIVEVDGIRILTAPNDACDGDHCEVQIGVLAITVVASHVELNADRCDVVIDGIEVPWAMQRRGPHIHWMAPKAWEVELPIFVSRITETGDCR